MDVHGRFGPAARSGPSQEEDQDRKWTHHGNWWDGYEECQSIDRQDWNDYDDAREKDLYRKIIDIINSSRLCEGVAEAEGCDVQCAAGVVHFATL